MAGAYSRAHGAIGHAFGGRQFRCAMLIEPGDCRLPGYSLNDQPSRTGGIYIDAED